MWLAYSAWNHARNKFRRWARPLTSDERAEIEAEAAQLLREGWTPKESR